MEEFLKASIHDPVAVFTFALFLTTLLLWWATRALVVSARDTTERQLRAYVIQSGSTISDAGQAASTPGWRAPLEGELVVKPNQPFAVVEFCNTGQTPAYEVRHWGTIDVIEPRHEKTLVAPSEFGSNASKTTIGSRGLANKPLTLPRQLSNEELVAIRSGQKAIYVYGRIQYLDAFKRSRNTFYRLKYSGNYPPLGQGSFQYCAEGNDSD